MDENEVKNFIDQMLELVDLHHKGVLILDSQQNIIKYNDMFLDIFNLKKDLTEKELKSKVDKVLQDYGIQKENLFFKSKEKKQINITYKAIHVFDKVYDAWLFETVSREDLRNSILENMVHFGQDGIHAVDMDGNMILYNKAQGKIDCLNPEEVLGKHATEIYALDENTSLLLKVLRTKQPIDTLRQSYYTRKGAFVDCVTSVIPLYYKDQMVGSMAIVRDYYNVLKTLEENHMVYGKDKKHQKPKYSKKQTRYNFSDILTVNEDFKRNIDIAKLAADTNSSVLIIGETGTGKEMFAQSIHDYSLRRKDPFVAINCAAIPETLLESLLFGTTKGTFTGAMDKPGLFETAGSGTVFLDEINSMSLFLQSKLLRVLEEKTVTRLGSQDLIHIDARIISSCNENPIAAVDENRLRGDLFYRLAVVYIVIPSLRKRPEDILYLTQKFIERYNQKFGKKVSGLSEKVTNFFYQYPWPGNVRQLKNLLESALNTIDTNESYLEMHHLPKYLFNEEDQLRYGFNYHADAEKIPEKALSSPASKKDKAQDVFERIEQEEKEFIIRHLELNRGNISKTARELGMSRQKLYYRLKKHGIK